ncbi:MAG: hypothetical protein ISN28_15585 [Ectothiorhodospiraceae bacterium AqS1]|nr:hypothetical protein [Ectothiorhodospiraceae bacterium AqS1]MBF2761654.1 hypothetical protein [Ectothiorhodospiraceae bacterium AqS1]
MITFTCSSMAESDCGYADYVLPSDLTPEQVALLKPVFEVRYGLNVHCGESADLLDLDRDLEPGESVSVIHASDTKRSFPWHMDCRANALDPFTLTVKTTRLAQ